MRKVINLKHAVCDYNCMLSGLEDLIEQELHMRLPQYLLFIGGYIGFWYEKRQEGKIQRQVEPGYGVGRVHYLFLADIFGFNWQMSENEPFETAWENIKKQIDAGKPVIAGELDMFHLPYLKKFYHRIHVPFHYLTIIGYDEEKEMAIVQDCSRVKNQEIPLSNIKKALSKELPGVCNPNTYFVFDFTNASNQAEEQVVRKILKKCAERFLNDEKQGLRGLKKLIGDFDDWQKELSARDFKKSLRYLVTYTCSNTPMLPQRLAFFKLDEVFLKHHGTRDRFSKLLIDIATYYNIKECERAAKIFIESGKTYQEITDIITDYPKSHFKTKRVKEALNKIVPLYQKIAELDNNGFLTLLGVDEK